MDKPLEDLIPDSAVHDPDHWALDTDAAKAPQPDVTALTNSEPIAPPADFPTLALPWPETGDPPPVAPVARDPDIDAVASAARQANGSPDVDALTLAAMRVEVLPGGVELAFPFTIAFPEGDNLVQRFNALSALRTLDKSSDNLAQVARRAREDAALIEQILHLYGYYDAEVEHSLSGIGAVSDPAIAPQAASSSPGSGRKSAVRNPAAGHVTVRFDIIPGVRYRIGHLDLGDLAQASDNATLVAAFDLHSGDPANTDQVIAARLRLIARLSNIGYAFAKVGDPAFAVDHESQLADLTIPVTTGGIYDFGSVTSLRPGLLNSRHLQRIARFRRGKIYDQRLIDDFRKAILATGVVSAVTITPHEAARPEGETPGIADLDVALTKGRSHTVSGQIGQSSGEGLRLELGWEDRNFFPPEGMVRLRGVIGTREQLAGVTFQRSNFLARDTALSADLFAQTLKTDAYNAHTASAILTLSKRSTLFFQKVWSYSLGVQIIATNELASASQPDATGITYYIAALPVQMGFDHSNNLLDPTQGFRITLSLSPEISEHDGLRSSYVKSQIDLSGYVPVDDHLVLAARGRLGSITGTTLDNIAPSRRFYAGGGASIRGYGYQAVGPRDENGNPTGGLSLAETSIEARIPTAMLGGGFSIVPFLDAGTAGATPRPTLTDPRFGAGMGVRYKTPFGPLRFDIGTPINPTRYDSRVGVYVGLGQAF